MKQSKIKETRVRRDKYIPVVSKFLFGHSVAVLWLAFSVFVSLPWLRDLSALITLPFALLVIGGIGYIPGYINMFTVAGLLMDKQPKYKKRNPRLTVTILIACWNEENQIEETLKRIKAQDYAGKIRVIIIDNASTDQTDRKSCQCSEKLGLDCRVIKEPMPGKFNALNTGIKQVRSKLVITLDADTLLHKNAVRNIVSRIESAPPEVCAVAGAVLARNSREKFVTRLQEWDYFLGIASIKRLQGLYQGTLVAQGAFSVYKTKVIREVDGWPNAIGEDIVLTWKALQKGYKVYFEPMAVAFTEVPSEMKHFVRQRSRWARGMIEALRMFKPWSHKLGFVRYLTGVNLIMPMIDVVYTLCFLPGIVLAFFGHYWIVGPMTLLVLPLAVMQNYILYSYQKKVFETLGLRIRKNWFGYLVFVLGYQALMSPISLLGYFQEMAQSKRVWK